MDFGCVFEVEFERCPERFEWSQRKKRIMNDSTWAESCVKVTLPSAENREAVGGTELGGQ